MNNPNGRDTLHLIKKLTGALRENDPDSLIEFRQAYATLATMPYATQFRAGDVPFDWMLNFARLVTIRLCMGDNIPIHADPAYWATGESPENIARHMISTLVGVPMLSMDLEKFSSQEKLIVSYWIGFYNQHRDLLNHGHWEFMFGCRDIDGAIVANAQQRIVFLLDAGRLPEILALGKNTIDCILSGLIIGHAKMIDGMIEEIEKELGEKAIIIATGGYNDIVKSSMKRQFDFIEPNLTLNGLRLIYQMQ